MSLQDILGTLIAGGMGGRTEGGPNFLQSLQGLMQQDEQPSRPPEQAPARPQSESGSFLSGDLAGMGAVAGLAFLGGKALNMYRERRQEQSGGGSWDNLQNQPASGQSQQGGFLSGLEQRFGMGGGQAPGGWAANAPPATTPDDDRAHLLIRTMIASVAAIEGGAITWEERNAILDQVRASSPSQEEHSLVEGWLNNPPRIDDVVAEVRDPETAQQVYHAATMAVRPDQPHAQDFLSWLANRLGVSPQPAWGR